MVDYREENDMHGRKLYANSWEDDLDSVKEAAKEEVRKTAPCEETCPEHRDTCTSTRSDHTVHECVQGNQWS